MAFIDAIDLASEAIAAEGISATAGDIATVANSSEAASVGTYSSLRDVATKSPDVAGVLPSATVPTILDPFPGNPLLGAALAGGLIMGGFYLTAHGFHTLAILGILFGAMFVLYYIVKKRSKS